MRAKFNYPWLELEEIGKIGLDGSYEIKGRAGGSVENLIESLFEFTDKLMENSRIDFIDMSTYNWNRVQNVHLDGAYKISFVVPCGIEFLNLERKVLGSLVVEQSGRVFGSLKIKRRVFTEEIQGYEEKFVEKVLNLALRHRIGYPLYMLKPEIEGENLVFRAPDGETVLEISDKNYKLNYQTFGGSLRKNSGVVLKWLEDAILRNCKENLESWTVRNKTLMLLAGKFKILYDINEKKLSDFDLRLNGLQVSSVASEIRITDWPARKVEGYILVGMKNMEKFNLKVGEKLWEFLKWLIF